MFDIARDVSSGDLQKDMRGMNPDERSGFLYWMFRKLAWGFIALALGGTALLVIMTIGG